MIYILGFCLVVTAALIMMISKEKKRILELESKLSEYSKYNHIKDVELEAKKILDQASEMKSHSEKLLSEADNMAKQVKAHALDEIEKEIEAKRKVAESFILDARVQCRNLLREAEEKMSSVNAMETSLKAKVIEDNKALIKEAQEKSKTIIEKASAHEAHTAEVCKMVVANIKEENKKVSAEILGLNLNVQALEAQAKAYQNIIEGYQEKYFVPRCVLLDSLIEGYSHAEAGSALRVARDASLLLVKNGLAADNDYAEENRRNTAIEFVLDAFNGKVESILSSLKSSNYGNLKQEIIDCFHLINQHGAAFRNARVTRVYLDSRLEELKCAATVIAIRDKEREEQRELRDQMREEAKAAKEYEKAMRDAEKEEQKLNQLMEKARAELAQANDKEREKYEMRLKDLEMKLVEAEEKNKRALSMAQQTKKGNVYIISNIGSFGEQIYKIGMTRRLVPQERIDELGDASVPFDFDVHALIESDDAPALEKELHRRFEISQVNKVNSRKEFFKVDILDLKKTVEELGFNVRWTLTAEAQEYRESLYIIQQKEAA